NFLFRQLGKQRLLAGEVAIESAAGQADARHQLIDTRGAEPTPLGDGPGTADELLASFLFVRAWIAHGSTSVNLNPLCQKHNITSVCQTLALQLPLSGPAGNQG